MCSIVPLTYLTEVNVGWSLVSVLYYYFFPFVYFFNCIIVLSYCKCWYRKKKSAADAAAVNSNDIKIIVANDWDEFFINGKPVNSNGRRSLPRNSPDCIILDSSVFDRYLDISS